ncbi:GMC oxidoreductase-domain-containing protein, partial [Mycena epipterygia]
DAQFLDIINTISTSGPDLADVNSVANVNAIGVGTPSYTIDENRNRTSVRSRLTDVQVSSKGKLTISFNTLATKIALCDPGAGGSPTAFGVEIAVGGAISVASNFNGKGMLTTKLVTVRHEVIVSAGVFQSPQLVGCLILSGIGNETELQKFGIDPVVNLPGVGANLQDHDEVASVWSLKENYTLFDGCTFLYTTEDDPCLATWESSGHQNVYGFGPAVFTIMARSTPDLVVPDLFTYWLPADFRGFNRGFAQEL